MVTHIVLQTGAAFLLIIGAVKAADFWVEKRTKERIKTKTVEIWYQFASSDPLVVVKAPLRLISKGLDSIYGLKVVSWRSFWRSSVVSTCLLMASLAITGMIVGTPFALESPPWKMFDQTFETVDEVMKNPAYWKDKKPEEIS